MEEKKRPVGRKQNIVEGTAHVGHSAGASSGGGGGQKRDGGGGMMKLVILAAIALLGGGGGLGALMGSGNTTTPAPSVTTPPAVTAPAVTTPAVTTPAVTAPAATPTSSGRRLNTSVSDKARAKRVKLKGGGKDTTTILVYMCGTDLESSGGFATKDLQEMLNATVGDKINLLVYTGGCKKWKNNVISSSKNQIYQIKNGQLSLVAESSKLQPMTDPNTLAQFIQWGKQNAPADRYELIFWDHGGGSVSGYGYDEVYKSSGSMDLAGIDTALKTGGVTFDFIGFDACLMATLETALVAERYADYLIASEETEPGCGWYYTDWLTRLNKNPSMSALEIGQSICDTFVQKCGEAAARQQATLSVIDLAELHGTVPEPFANFAQATTEAIKTDSYKTVATARGKTKEFAQSNHIDQIDLIHLADNLNTKESKALAAVLREAVKYNATSSNISNANGVSAYFPYGRTSNVNKMAAIYDKIDLDESYTNCIKTFASLEVGGQTVSGGSSAQLDSLFGALMGGGMAPASSSSGVNSAAMVAQLLGALAQSSGRSLANVDLTKEEAGFLDTDLLERSAAYLTENQFDDSALVWTEKNGQKVLVLPEDQWDLIQNIELNVFVDDGVGYVDLGLDNVFNFNDDGDLIGEYNQTWMCVNRQIVAFYTLLNEGTEDDYTILGYIPARLNGQNVRLMVSFTDEVPDGEILGADPDYDETTETATVSRGLIEIEDGDNIEFLYNFYDYKKNFQDAYHFGETLKVSGPLEIRNIRMDNENYIAAYRLTDIYNNHYWTPAM